jgi:hypothetical protein
MTIWTLDDLHRVLSTATSGGNARAAVRRAARIVDINANAELDLHDLVRVCSALSAEGGAIQRVAEEIASDALHDDDRIAA